MLRALRFTVLLVLVALIGAGTVVITARIFGWQSGPLYYLVAMTPYFGAALATGAVFAALARSRVLAVVSGALAVIVAFWWLPVFLPSPAAGTSGVQVMTANLYYGEADPEAVVAAVRDQKVDVLSVQELTGPAVAGLLSAGLSDELPYEYLRPSGSDAPARGTGLWSRYPLTDRDETPRLPFTNLSATVSAPGGDVTVFAVHAVPPSPVDGNVGARTFKAVQRFLTKHPGPGIAAGDFNATRDNVPLRNLEGAGWVDAAAAARAGFVRTWPQDRQIGPLVALDHVLTRGLPDATEVTVVDLPGSDHRAIVARVPVG